MIKIKILNKSFNKKKVLENLDMYLPSNGLIVLEGKNGCGKTTLLDIIGGFDIEYTGSITFMDKELNKGNISKYRLSYVSYVTQENILFEDLTLVDNLKKGTLIKIAKEKIDNTLVLVGLENLKSQKVNTLSIGEKQRLCIARLLLKDPQIILADEITSALDKENEERIFKLLKELSKTKLIIMTLHDNQKAISIADEIYRFDNDRLQHTRLNIIVDSKKLKRVEQSSIRSTLKLISYFFKSFWSKFLLLFILLLTLFTSMSSIMSHQVDSLTLSYDYSLRHNVRFWRTHKLFPNPTPLEARSGNHNIDFIELSQYFYEDEILLHYKTLSPSYSDLLYITGMMENIYTLKSFSNVEILYGNPPKQNDQYLEVLISISTVNAIMSRNSELFGKPENILNQIYAHDYKIIGIFNDHFDEEKLKNSSLYAPANFFSTIILTNFHHVGKDFESKSALLYLNGDNIESFRSTEQLDYQLENFSEIWRTKEHINSLRAFNSLLTIALLILSTLIFINIIKSLYLYYQKDFVLFRLLGYTRKKILFSLLIFISSLFLVSGFFTIITGKITLLFINKNISLSGLGFYYDLLTFNSMFFIVPFMALGVFLLLLIIRSRRLLNSSISKLVREFAK